MRDSLRLRIGWLHAWLGLLGGLVLFCIFLSGTLAVFDDEITLWMQPDAVVGTAQTPSPQAVTRTAAALEQAWRTRPFAFLMMPGARRPGLHVVSYDGHAFVGPTLDPADGHVVPLRATEGGAFFYDLHFTLRLGERYGALVVAVLALVMLVGVVSGVVLHVRGLVRDLLTFRPFAGRFRAWLDGHVLTGVLCLPFIVMMAYTGAVIEADLLFPVPRPVADDAAAVGVQTDGVPFEGVLARALGRGADVLAPDRIGFVLFDATRISVYRSDASRLAMTRDHVDFDRADGRFLGFVRSDPGGGRVQQVVDGLHIAQWTPWPMRWLYFLSGLAGTVLIGSGLVLFFIKRRSRFGATLPFRLGEGLVLAVVSGLPGASVGFLWANRLIPPSQAGRAGAEVAVFFGVWGLWAVGGVVASLAGCAAAGWRRALEVLGVLALCLPLLDWAVRPVGGGVSPGVTVGVWGVAVALGAAAVGVRWVLRRGRKA